MAINFNQQKQKGKKPEYLNYVLIAAVLVLIFGIWWVFLRKPKNVPAEVSQQEIAKVWQKKIDINFEILDNPLFKSLKDFEKILPFDGKTGRDNPFLR